ncbi:MAG: M81 family metallopeptidase, partial [Alphaproteobacteria bacterium]|nr:M81 family metallopeptidase [Alphaproteobacteria bacterium]
MIAAMGDVRRVALLGFSLESNGHAPVATEAEFRAYCWLEGDELGRDLRAPTPRGPAEFVGFSREMDARGAWIPVPILMTAGGASGPVDQDFFERVLGRMREGLHAALPLDAVYIAEHGAATATGDDDPDATLFEMVRAVVGRDVPVVATLDLHANASQRMVDAVDMVIGYRTNPHVDMAERGAEAAAAIHEIWAGMRPAVAFVKLPLMPPSITQNTDIGPYGDLLRLAASRQGRHVINATVLSGFSNGDTPKNGMSVIVTARGDAHEARRVAHEIAAAAWADRHRYVPEMTGLADAVAAAAAAGRDPSLPAPLLADVADNPGGGGRGNTTWILKALAVAGVRGAILGTFYDPPLAEEAHRRGVGARFMAQFNRAETDRFSEPWAADAVVEALHDGVCVGRRGIFAGRLMDLGASALLQVGDLRVTVNSNRQQMLDPVFFEIFGIDIAAARSVVVKSRGHFRAAF